jgi:hypothetical protein
MKTKEEGHRSRTRLRRRSTLVLVAALAFGACSGGTSPNARLRVEAEWNRARWRGRHVQSYTYEYRRGCFCGVYGLVRLHVANGAVVAVTPIDAYISPLVDPLTAFPTVDELFDVVIDAADRADDLRVTYDRDLGYPTSISIDYDVKYADDEIFHSAEKLTPVN